jgi:hypothetical protein
MERNYRQLVVGEKLQQRQMSFFLKFIFRSKITKNATLPDGIFVF